MNWVLVTQKERKKVIASENVFSVKEWLKRKKYSWILIQEKKIE